MAKAKAKAATKAPAKKKAPAAKAKPAAKPKAAAPKKAAPKAGAKKAAPKAEAKKALAPKAAEAKGVAATGSPLAAAKARFGKDDAAEAKKALVAAVRDLAGKDLWVDALNEDKGLERVSNRKLLHLHDVLTAVKAKFSSRKALIDAIADAKKRKDDAFLAQLGALTTARLWDTYRASAN